MFAGGCIGGALRLGLDQLIPVTGPGLPLDIAAINVVGSFALGILTAWTLVQGRRWWVPFLGTGLLGGFTTFSLLEALPWESGAHPGAALALLVGTTVASVAAAALGWVLGTRIAFAQERRGELLS